MSDFDLLRDAEKKAREIEVVPYAVKRHIEHNEFALAVKEIEDMPHLLQEGIRACSAIENENRRFNCFAIVNDASMKSRKEIARELESLKWR